MLLSRDIALPCRWSLLKHHLCGRSTEPLVCPSHVLQGCSEAHPCQEGAGPLRPVIQGAVISLPSSETGLIWARPSALALRRSRDVRDGQGRRADGAVPQLARGF